MRFLISIQRTHVPCLWLVTPVLWSITFNICKRWRHSPHSMSSTLQQVRMYSKIACEGCCRCLDVRRYDLHLLYSCYLFSSSVVLHQLNWTKQELDVLWNRCIFGSLSPQNTFAPREPAISTAVQFICLLVCVATWVVLLVWAHQVYCMCLWCTQLNICNMCLCPSNFPGIQWISCNL